MTKLKLTVNETALFQLQTCRALSPIRDRFAQMTKTKNLQLLWDQLMGAKPKAIFFAALAFLFIGASAGRTDQAENLKLTTQQWREDLTFLSTELPKRHKNAFHEVSRQQFEAAVAALDQNLDKLDADEIVVGMRKITSLVGDGHTSIFMPLAFARFPLVIGQFGEEYWVTKVAPGFEKALGTRLVKIGGTSLTRVRALMSVLAPQAEPPGYSDLRAVSAMNVGNVLHGLDIIPDHNIATYVFAGDDGQDFSIDMRAIPQGEFARTHWVSIAPETPLREQNAEEDFWFTYLADTHAVYCNFRRYADLGRRAKDLMKFVQERAANKLVIDMRQNGGGDYKIGLRDLVQPIRNNPQINQKGHLFVLIGAATLSAAMNNATHFRAQTAAILVGEPCGARPNGYQESREMRLPNSRITVSYSVAYYTFVESSENLVRPDQEIKPTWQDARTGKDPVLDWALTYGSE